MQSKDANELRKKWGKKPCTHPKIDRLYDLGSHDGYVCTQCGEEHYNKEDFKREGKSVE